MTSPRHAPKQHGIGFGKRIPRSILSMIDFIEQTNEGIGGIAYLEVERCRPGSAIRKLHELRVFAAKLDNVGSGGFVVHTMECGAGAKGGQIR